MENLIVSEKQLEIEFSKKVSPEQYSLMIKILGNHWPAFSGGLFEAFVRAVEKKKLDVVLDLFKSKPRNVEETKIKLLMVREILLNPD